VAVGLGVGLAGEHIAAYGLVAMLVIVLGVALLLLGKR
jgi:drug/metabolite transporter (DMT)-like permease